MDTFFTWEALSAMGGASMLTFMIVAYTKQYVKYIKTDLYAVLVAYAVLLASQLALGASPADWRVYALTFANSFLVAAASGKMNDLKTVNNGNTGT
jgi:hypothetical protein